MSCAFFIIVLENSDSKVDSLTGLHCSATYMHCLDEKSMNLARPYLAPLINVSVTVTPRGLLSQQQACLCFSPSLIIFNLHWERRGTARSASVRSFFPRIQCREVLPFVTLPDVRQCF